MSPVYDTDNEDHLFDFDTYEDPDLHLFSTADPRIRQPGLNAIEALGDTSADTGTSASEETGPQDIDKKGKGVAKSMPIRVPAVAVHNYFDMENSLSTVASTSSNSRQSFPFTPITPPYYLQHSLLSNIGSNAEPSTDQIVGDPFAERFDVSSWKGKQKASPPVLPPLTFSSAGFTYPSSFSSPLPPSSIAPSSYASSCGPLLADASDNIDCQENNRDERRCSAPSSTPAVANQNPPHSAERHPVRHRSLSDISVRSDRSLAARSINQLKLKLSRPSSSLARKLLFRKGDQEVPIATSSNAPEVSGLPDRWRTGLKVDELDATASHPQDLHLLDINSKLPNMFFYSGTPLKHKGRSKSSPFPRSALDYIPAPPTDTFSPFLLVTKNYFDEFLPRELRIRIFEALVSVHEADHLRIIKGGRWSVSKASSPKNRWDGRGKGFRELVKLSRVSKSWQALAFDGQLWANFNFHSFPGIPESLILRITAVGGSCARILDISGHSHLSAATLLDMTEHFCIDTSPDIDSLCYTQLTTINLQGCSLSTARSLHHLLACCRSLRKLCLKGLPAVTNVTCNIISSYCPQLVSLDISRCSKMDADGIRRIADAARERGEVLLLKELRMCGLRNVNDKMMAALGRVTPFLEVLDLSYARQLHNSAVEAFVACGMDESLGLETVLISPRDIGREVSDARLRRRVTRLRHLALSSCPLLTDDACANLAYAVPQLEFLELAGIGSDIKSDGLVRLLKTTPCIRRLDLEDASNITDAVLVAITPGANLQLRPSDLGPEPGHALEQLNISFATEITDDALLNLIHGCKRLKHLEADNTRINSSVLKEFVRHCRKRKMLNAKANVVDCRGITESIVKDLSGSIRPRLGIRAYEFRKLTYLDVRDGNIDELKIGQDECDEKRVVLKSFYSWQTVDSVKACRERRVKTSKALRASSQSTPDSDVFSSGRPFRWWAPGGRRTMRSGSSSPLNMTDLNGDGCRMM